MKWYQLHLSTLLVLMLLAGVLVWLNVWERALARGWWPVLVYGWPITAVESHAGGHPSVDSMALMIDVALCLLHWRWPAGIEWGTRRMRRKPTP
jgi:hypothetical protein